MLQRPGESRTNTKELEELFRGATIARGTFRKNFGREGNHPVGFHGGGRVERYLCRDFPLPSWKRMDRCARTCPCMPAACSCMHMRPVHVISRPVNDVRVPSCIMHHAGCSYVRLRTRVTITLASIPSRARVSGKKNSASMNKRAGPCANMESLSSR